MLIKAMSSSVNIDQAVFYNYLRCIHRLTTTAQTFEPGFVDGADVLVFNMLVCRAGPGAAFTPLECGYVSAFLSKWRGLFFSVYGGSVPNATAWYDAIHAVFVAGIVAGLRYHA